MAHPAAPFAVALATACHQIPIFDRFFSAMDEGHILHFADLFRNGGLIYRDATSYPLPGAFYVLALCFELFEPSIRVARWVVLLESNSRSSSCSSSHFISSLSIRIRSRRNSSLCRS